MATVFFTIFTSKTNIASLHGDRFTEIGKNITEMGINLYRSTEILIFRQTIFGYA